MKRLITVFLASLIVLGVFGLCPINAAEAPTISVSDAEGSVGDQVVVPVRVESNPGIIAMGLRIEFDSSALELKNAVGKDYADVSFGPVKVNKFNITWEDGLNPNNTADGVIAELTFLIKEGTPDGEYGVAVSYNENNIFDSELQNVAFAVKNGKVTVVPKKIPVTGVTIDETLSVGIGVKKTPAYQVIPDNADDKTVTFSSDAPDIASVDEKTGEVTGVKEGTANITVTTKDGGFTDTCKVFVACVHTNVTQIEAKDSSCSEKGWDAYSKCDYCGQLFDEEGNEISKIPYRELEPHTEGEHIKENESAPTCELDGHYDDVVYCTACNAELSREQKTIPALGHDWDEGTVTKEPTCTDKGEKTFTCKNDNTHTYTEEIPALGHDYKAEVVPPTCTEKGYTLHTCSQCGDSYKDEYVDALGHNWDDGVVTKAPTSSSTGIKTYTCLNDSSHTYTEEIPKLSVTPSKEEADSAPVNKAIKKPAGIKTVCSVKKKQMKISFKAVSGAVNYRIAYRKAGAKKWTFNWTKGKTSYVLKKLKAKGLYEFKFAAYKLTDGVWERGSWSKSSYRYFSKTTQNKPKAGKKSVKVSWKKDTSAGGFYIFYSAKKSMSGQKKITVKGKTKTSYTIKKLSKGKKYYIRVRAYKVKSKKTYLGELSAIKSVKAK